MTVEVSIPKHPPANSLSAYWDQNRLALLSFCEQAIDMSGIRGVITRGGKPVTGAAIYVDGRETLTIPDANTGFYERLMMPGVYNMTLYAPPADPVMWRDVRIEYGKQLVRDVNL